MTSTKGRTAKSTSKSYTSKARVGKRAYDRVDYNDYPCDRKETEEIMASSNAFAKFGDIWLKKQYIESVEFL